MSINTLAAGDGKKPGCKIAIHIKLTQTLKCFYEGILRELGSIRLVAAKLANKGVDPVLETPYQVLKGRQGAGLGLAGKFLVGQG